MKHSYKITGMPDADSIKKSAVAINNLQDVVNVTLNIAQSEVTIEMTTHIPLDKLQETLLSDGLSYSIEPVKAKHGVHKSHNKCTHSATIKRQLHYCPMHCEGEKTYPEPGNCPICGMDLLVQPKTSHAAEYTCPMHAEIIENKPGPCPICGMALILMEPDEDKEEQAYKALVNKMTVASVFSLPVFIISMSDLIPGNPLANIMSHQSWGWVQLLLTLPVVFYACSMFFVRAYQSIVTWNLNMFTLVGMGTGVAFLFSVIGLLFPDIFPDEFRTDSGSIHFYFEATAVILTLVLLGQLLEAKAHSQTSGALKALLKLAPSEAILIKNGEEVVISIHDIALGDILRVKPGDKIPVDGKISTGQSSIDESMISGEPIPLDKKAGDKVSAGTINGTKSFEMLAEKVGADTLLAQIIQMVGDASRSRAPIQKLADSIAKYFVPIVIVISLITFAVWSIAGPEPALVYALVNAIAVLIIACPCALGLATPMAVMVGVGKGAQSGILIKNAEALQNMNDIDVLITDKTGTITEGKPSVEQVFAVGKQNVNELLHKIASINQYSEHPLASAVVEYAKTKGTPLTEIKDFEAIAGQGVMGTVSGSKVILGNSTLMEKEQIIVSSSLSSLITAQQKLGKTVSYIAVDGEALGFVAISDAIKPSSISAISALMAQGIEVIMMTGDNRNTAKSVAEQLHLKEFVAQCLPEDKLNKIKELQAQGKRVAMAGDGINDSPALAQADVGIAMGTGTDVAIESAEITLVKGDLHGIVKVKTLSHEVMKNIKQNLFFAFIYNMLGVPIAAGVLFPFYGILLSPMIAATAMSFSSVSVIVNSLRLKSMPLN